MVTRIPFKNWFFYFLLLVGITSGFSQEASLGVGGSIIDEKIPKASKQLPEELKGWVDWVTWDQDGVPSLYNNDKVSISNWSSELTLNVNEKDGNFRLPVTLFKKGRLQLPGDNAAWPLNVKVNGEEVPVIINGGKPEIILNEGAWDVEGNFKWSEMPQTINLPVTVGVLKLSRNGKELTNPSWDTNGRLWLKRTVKEETDKNFLEVKVYRNLEDGAPTWLYTDLEITVTGKSREEELGAILPEDWKISSVSSSIPCAIDEKGTVKAQVRAGKWVVSIVAFRTTPTEMVQYASGLTPIVKEELLSLQNNPNFRLIEFFQYPSS